MAAPESRDAPAATSTEPAPRRILVLCPHPENVAPGQRLKYEQYFTYLRDQGYDLTVSPFMSPAFHSIVYQKGRFLQKVAYTLAGYLRRCYDLLRLPWYDGAYVFLWFTPFGTPFFEMLMRLMARRYLYDIDDMVFLGHKSKANPMIAFLKGRSKMIYLMKHARHVITCTPALDEFVRRHNTRTTDISSTINTQTYQPVNSYSNDRPLVLGWSGSHSTSRYLHLLQGVLQKLGERHRFRVRVIGDPEFTMEGVETEALAWQESTEVRDLQEIDIGLYPLPDEPWVYGKSGLKALQYMALGIPTVAAAIGANFRVIEDGRSGFLVKNNEEWLERLEQLLENPDLRRSIGTRARERVQNFYSVKANEPVYLDVMNDVFRRN